MGHSALSVGRPVAGAPCLSRPSNMCSTLCMTVRLEWDEEKDAANQRKHGVGFESAARVFADPDYVLR